MYRAIKNGSHPHSLKQVKKGDVIDLFHTIGDKFTKGKKAWLVRSKKVDPNTALAIQLENEKEIEN